MNHDTWVWRCCMCGEYAHGHGEVPELWEHWVCGPCAVEELPYVDLDLGREG